MENTDSFRQIISRLPQQVKEEMEYLPQEFTGKTEEIRLRCGQSIRLQGSDWEKTISHIVTAEDLKRTLNNLIRYSYYAYEEDLAKGFITIEGGHRVGICGKAVVKNGQTTLIREISSINIRFCREVKGCAEKVAGSLFSENGKAHNTLIVSPPGCGKTTLLRDIARIISYKGYRTAICDERSEIAGMYGAHPSFDLGPRTDILDGAPKAQGMEMLIRSMSPQVLITDEIGRKEDTEAIRNCFATGVAVITSVHGKDAEDAQQSAAGQLLKENVFKKIICLSRSKGPGTVEAIINV